MKVTATTLPRRSLRARRAPSWVVSVNSGAGPIRDRRASPLGSWPPAVVGEAHVASARSAARDRGLSRPTLALQLLLQLVEKSPVGTVGDDLFGIGPDDARLVQSQRVEPHSIFDFILAPPAVWNLLHCLEGVVVALREAPFHDDAGDALGFRCADLVGLHDCPQGALGGHGVSLDEVFVGHHPTAEIL